MKDILDDGPKNPDNASVPIHGLEDDVTLVNLEGVEDPRQLAAISEGARIAAAGGQRVVLHLADPESFGNYGEDSSRYD